MVQTNGWFSLFGQPTTNALNLFYPAHTHKCQITFGLPVFYWYDLIISNSLLFVFVCNYICISNL